MESNKKVRARFAPSPTGYLHIGGLRTALYNYLFAKQNGGKFILRIEDTDQKRFVPGALESLLGSLKWAGLDNDEGASLDKNTCKESQNYPGVFECGEYGEYIQSERLKLYKDFAQQLVDQKKAYYCFCDEQRLEAMRAQQQAENKPPMYDKHCANLSDEEVKKNIAAGKPYVIRLNVPKDKVIIFEDIVRKKVSFSSNTIDDQVLLKSDGFPTYHLANVVDDHLMEISHVIRGEEWLPSTPKHILLYEAFGWDSPKFAHIPLLLNTDKKKLSKRQGDVAVEDYIKKGYLKEALINFVALLGWNPGEGSQREVFSLDDLIENFKLDKVHKAGAVFDTKKLDWINSQYIKKLTLEQLYELTISYLEQKDFFLNASLHQKTKEYILKVLEVEQERMLKLSDVGDENVFFFQKPQYDKSLLKWKDLEDDKIIHNIFNAINRFQEITDWSKEEIEKNLLEIAGENRGELLWPVRAALSGAQRSPSPFEIAWVLGKNETIQRLNEATKKL